MSKIPIKALKQLSKDYGLDHVIVFATEGKTQHIATYGKTIEGCSEAADFGNKLKDAMGWPESLHTVLDFQFTIRKGTSYDPTPTSHR